jgi:hypothetical protein
MKTKKNSFCSTKPYLEVIWESTKVRHYNVVIVNFIGKASHGQRQRPRQWTENDGETLCSSKSEEYKYVKKLILGFFKQN